MWTKAARYNSKANDRRHQNWRPPIVQKTTSSLCSSFHVVVSGRGLYDYQFNSGSITPFHPIYFTHDCSCRADQVAGLTCHIVVVEKGGMKAEREILSGRRIYEALIVKERCFRVRGVKCRRGVFLSGRRIRRARRFSCEVRLHDNAAAARGSYRYH